MNKAIFLDRDGVINYPIFNQKINEYEAPHKPEDLKLYNDVIESLKDFKDLDYLLFVVSNQPDYAKGKTSLENLKTVHEKLSSVLSQHNIKIIEYYYCFHHPQGIIPEYSIKCKCRKPGTWFLEDAKLKYEINMQCSWFIGDRDTDIFCGQSMGTKTILIKTTQELSKVGKSNPDFKANTLKEIVDIIKNNSK